LVWAWVVAGVLPLPKPALAAWKYFDPTDTAAIPKRFSETGFYDDWSSKAVTATAHRYEVNSPLWSDGASKDRWILLPQGKPILFNENSDLWDYPDSAVFIKLFKHQAIAGDSSTTALWETRVLVNQEIEAGGKRVDAWHGFSYKWAADGSDAFLLSDEDGDSVFQSVFKYRNHAAGELKWRKWRFPKRGECLQCHRAQRMGTLQGRAVLGFFTAQLNRPSPNADSINQIIGFFNAGLMLWENRGATKPTEGDVSHWPRWARVADTTVDLNVRARSYIAANCSGCHGDRGISLGATGGRDVNFDFWQNRPHASFALREMSWNYNLPGSALVVPGRPDLSILLHRQKQRRSVAQDVAQWEADTSSTRPTQPVFRFGAATDQMPPLGVFEEDTVAMQVLTEWVNHYRAEDDVSVRRARSGSGLSHPIQIGNHLRLPEGMQEGPAYLIALNGQSIPLPKVAGNLYALPASISPGIYGLRVGKVMARLIMTKPAAALPITAKQTGR
jgi:hypothetical protein